jgi:hypothetical protein
MADGNGNGTNGNGVWVRWAGGIIMGCVIGSLGFEIKQAMGFSALQQQVADEMKRSDDDRIRLHEEMRAQFTMLTDQMETMRQWMARDREELYKRQGPEPQAYRGSGVGSGRVPAGGQK